MNIAIYTINDLIFARKRNYYILYDYHHTRYIRSFKKLVSKIYSVLSELSDILILLISYIKFCILCIKMTLYMCFYIEFNTNIFNTVVLYYFQIARIWQNIFLSHGHTSVDVHLQLPVYETIAC